MGPLGAIATIGAPLVGGLLGMRGQRDANQANAQQVREQMEFQREMANTSWQRGVEDMRRAGLNPALAYQKGGAATPGGAAATMQNEQAALASGVSSAGAAVQARQQFKLASAEAAVRMQLTQAQAEKTSAEGALIRDSMADSLAARKLDVDRLKATIAKFGSDMESAAVGREFQQLQMRLRQQEFDRFTPLREREFEDRHQGSLVQRRLQEAQREGVIANTRQAGVRTGLLQQESDSFAAFAAARLAAAGRAFQESTAREAGIRTRTRNEGQDYFRRRAESEPYRGEWSSTLGWVNSARNAMPLLNLLR